MSLNATDPQSHKGKTDVWLTPMWVIDALGPFDLDPCGEEHHKTAKTIYTNSGLDIPWFGKVWLNPPYSQAEKWVERLASHGNGVALIFNRMDTKMHQKYVRLADSVLFIEGRIPFLTKDLEKRGNPGCGSILMSFGYVPDYSKIKGWSVENKHDGIEIL